MLKPKGLRERLKRNFTISSSCGVCGKTSIDSITQRITPIESRAKIAALDDFGLRRQVARRRRKFSPPLAVFMRADCSTSKAICWRRARISDGITRSTKSSDGRSPNRMLPLSKSVMMVSGRLEFRNRPESRRGGHSDSGRGLRAVIARGRTGGRSRDHAGRIPARCVIQRVHASREDQCGRKSFTSCRGPAWRG